MFINCVFEKKAEDCSLVERMHLKVFFFTLLEFI